MGTSRLPNHWINPNRIREVVSEMLGIKSLNLKDWHYEPIVGGLEFTNTLYRCHGVADSGEQTIPWSLIAKITSKEGQSEHPEGYRYWKREALFYQASLTDIISEQLAVPQVYAVDEDSENTVVIWMEDLIDDFQGQWPIEVYEKTAFQLGLFNSSFLTQQQVSGESWMTRDWLKKYVEHAAPAINFIKNNPDDPMVISKFGEAVPFLLTFWKIRNDLFQYLEKMPQVFCHQDTIKGNLFIKNGHLTAIDWGYGGMAPLGTDLAPLIALFPGLSDFPQDKAHELERACFTAYYQSVKSINPHLSARSLRRSVLYTFLLRYFLGATGELLPYLLDDKKRESLAQAFGESVEEVTQTDEYTVQFIKSKVFQTLKLMKIRTLIKFFYYMLYYSVWYKRHAASKA